MTQIETIAVQLASSPGFEAVLTLAIASAGLPQLLALLRGGDGKRVPIETWVVLVLWSVLWGACAFVGRDAWGVADHALIAIYAASITGLTIYRRTQASHQR